jgi:hypothetical protein
VDASVGNVERGQPLYLVELEKFIKQRLESTGCQPTRGEDGREKLTSNCATWLCIDCCWDTYHLDEPDESLRVLVLVGNVWHSSFLQKRLRLLFEGVEGPVAIRLER